MHARLDHGLAPPLRFQSALDRANNLGVGHRERLHVAVVQVVDVDQSALMPALRITSPQRGVSRRITAPSSSGVVPVASRPNFNICSRPSGDWMTRLISALMRSTIGRGVPAGAWIAFQPAMSSA